MSNILNAPTNAVIAAGMMPYILNLIIIFIILYVLQLLGFVNLGDKIHDASLNILMLAIIFTFVMNFIFYYSGSSQYVSLFYSSIGFIILILLVR